MEKLAPVYLESSAKENLLKEKPPTPQLFKLGEAYKKHKEKLKEELRQEYRQALVEVSDLYLFSMKWNFSFEVSIILWAISLA